MAVRIDHPGNERLALHIDGPGARTTQRCSLGVASYKDNAIAADGNGLRMRMRGVSGINACIVQDQVRLLRACGRRAEQTNGQCQKVFANQKFLRASTGWNLRRPLRL